MNTKFVKILLITISTLSIGPKAWSQSGQVPSFGRDAECYVNAEDGRKYQISECNFSKIKQDAKSKDPDYFVRMMVIDKKENKGWEVMMDNMFEVSNQQGKYFANHIMFAPHIYSESKKTWEIDYSALGNPNACGFIFNMTKKDFGYEKSYKGYKGNCTKAMIYQQESSKPEKFVKLKWSDANN